MTTYNCQISSHTSYPYTHSRLQNKIKKLNSKKKLVQHSLSTQRQRSSVVTIIMVLCRCAKVWVKFQVRISLGLG